MLVRTTSFAQVIHRYRGGPVVTDQISEGNKHAMKIPRSVTLVMVSCLLVHAAPVMGAGIHRQHCRDRQRQLRRRASRCDGRSRQPCTD